MPANNKREREGGRERKTQRKEREREKGREGEREREREWKYRRRFQSYIIYAYRRVKVKLTERTYADHSTNPFLRMITCSTKKLQN